MKIENEFFTGKTGLADLTTKIIGKKYLVITLYDESILVYPYKLNNDDILEDALKNKDVMEWTSIIAYSEEDAKEHTFKAHNQWYDKLNGIKNWKQSAILGIRS